MTPVESWVAMIRSWYGSDREERERFEAADDDTEQLKQEEKLA